MSLESTRAEDYKFENETKSGCGVHSWNFQANEGPEIIISKCNHNNVAKGYEVRLYFKSTTK